MTSHMPDGPWRVLVTGASSGIGRATAHELSTRGHHVWLLARGEAALQETADECRARGAASATVVAHDLREVLPDLPTFDAVVHSAGVAAYGRVEDIPADVFEGVLATNVLGTANLLRAVLPGMRAQGRGVVSVVGSLLGDVAVPFMGPYVTSKWAVRGLVHLARQENRAAGVKFTLVTPGGVDTPIYYRGATYAGRAGQPPPPVYSPQAAGRKIVAALPRAPRRLDVGVGNPVIRLGFAVVPQLFDAVIVPVFKALAMEHKASPDGPGNVLAEVPGQQLRGRHPWFSRRGSR